MAKRVLLITVGTSAIFNEEICRESVVLRTKVNNFRDSPEQYKTMALNQLLFDGLLERHRVFWRAPVDYQRSIRNRRQTSAELVSTDLAMRTGNRWRPERVVLLHSDTNEGRMAAELNRRIMVELWGALGVESEEIAGLDANLNEVDVNLRACLSDRIRLDPDHEVVLNFTGGFKGVIPFYTVLAFQRGWRLFFMHEDGLDARLLKLPARIPNDEQGPDVEIWPDIRK